MRVRTPNQAAGDTRRQIILMIRRMMAQPAHGKALPEIQKRLINGETLIADIQKMAKRASAKPGGLGRK